MGWERRGSSQYYYRKIRRGRCVVSEYVGSGELAILDPVVLFPRCPPRIQSRRNLVNETEVNNVY